MNFATAINTFCDYYYSIAKNNDWINDKVAWALYQTWKDADRDSKKQSFTFGERVAQLLKDKGISQREFADKCNITEVSMSRYIQGTRVPKAPLITTMAKHLGVSADYLLGLTDERSEK